jgi:hypothetical protein
VAQRFSWFALEFALGSGLPALDLILGGAAVYRCDNRPVFSAAFTVCCKTQVSYQGIALAMP